MTIWIPCQACEGKPKSAGCYTCGGYRVVLVQSKCSNGHVYWTRPGVHTSYNGKTWTSIDGLTLTWREGNATCSKCE